jgi:hypothetical protein
LLLLRAGAEFGGEIEGRFAVFVRLAVAQMHEVGDGIVPIAARANLGLPDCSLCQLARSSFWPSGSPIRVQMSFGPWRINPNGLTPKEDARTVEQRLLDISVRNPRSRHPHRCMMPKPSQWSFSELSLTSPP